MDQVAELVSSKVRVKFDNELQVAVAEGGHVRGH